MIKRTLLGMVLALFVVPSIAGAQATVEPQNLNFSEIYENAGIDLPAGIGQALESLYPTGSWQRGIIAGWDEALLSTLLTYQYGFLFSNSPADVERRQSFAATYLDEVVGFRSLLEDNATRSLVFDTPEEVAEAQNSGQLVLVDTVGVPLASNFTPLLRSETAALAEGLFRSLNAAGLIQEFWITSATRSREHNRLLRAFAFPAAPVEWGINPTTYGGGLTVAVAGTVGTGGAYDRFLNTIDQEEFEAYATVAEQSQTPPTIQSLIDYGVITDPDFLAGWQVLQQSGFTIVDLTGFYSVELHRDGTFTVGIINPVVVLADFDNILEATPTP